MSLSELLQDAIKSTEQNPHVSWNDPSWAEKVNAHPEFSVYMKNEPIPHHENRKCHGYFALLHNIVSRLPDNAKICELGNREGLSTIAILDALKSDQRFVTIDTVQDLRFVDPTKANPLVDRDSFLALVGDCLHPSIYFMTKAFLGEVHLLFCDTIHTYRQIRSEINIYKDILVDGAIILVDDTRDNGGSTPTNDTKPDGGVKWKQRDKHKYFQEWEGEKHDITELCHYPTGFAAFVYRRNTDG